MATYTYEGTSYGDVVTQDDYLYDYIYTYGGDDDIYLKANKTYVEAGSGSDYVKSTIEWGNKIYLGSGNDTYVGDGYSGSTSLYDRVYGGTGNDKVYISTYASEYYGQDGNDYFYAEGRNNIISGGAGSDTVDYSWQSGGNLKGDGVKVDLQNGYATSGGSYEETLSSIENAKGTSYADTLLGSSADNYLVGGKGNDVLNGRAGDDDIYGGKGFDKLTGGTGADYFIFASVSESAVGSKRDVITDFYRSEGDKIDLSDIDAISGGGDSKFDFIGSDSFSDTAGELRFSGGILSGDVDGDGVADFQIKVSGVSSLKSSDFFL